MAIWRLFRYHHRDGGSKDWAIMTEADGSIITRWGKTTRRLAGFSHRQGLRQSDLERQKQNKGYVLVGEVAIDEDGTVRLADQHQNQQPTTQSLSDLLPNQRPNHSKAAIGTLYWHIDCQGTPEVCLAFSTSLRQMICDLNPLKPSNVEDPLNALTDLDNLNQQNLDWDGWSLLLASTDPPQHLTGSGQIQSQHGVKPLLLLMALKLKAFVGIEIGIATDFNREVSADLKAEADLLAFFQTDLECVRPLAERLGLLQPKLDLTDLSDREDCWF